MQQRQGNDLILKHLITLKYEKSKGVYCKLGCTLQTGNLH